MKKLLISLTLLISISSFADDKLCVEAYKVGYEDLEQATRNYNQRYIGNAEFAGIVTAISTEVSVLRTICDFTEDPKQKKCVEHLKDHYKELRDQISVFRVMTGRQNEIEISTLDQFNRELKKGFRKFKCKKYLK